MTASGKGARQSGVELLRILAGMAVVALHFNYFPGGAGAADFATGFSRSFLELWECLCICAVNVFLLISGAFGVRSKGTKLRKLGLLLLQTMLFRVAANVAFGVYSHSLELKNVIMALLPLNYYVILYVTLMLLAPYINACLNRLSDAALRRLALIAFLLFSVGATAVDVAEKAFGVSLAGLSPVGLLGSMDGYSIVNFALLYLLGAWLKREEKTLERVKTPLVAAMLVGAAVLIWLWRRALPNTAWLYSNPLVIFEACAAFVLFSRLRFSSRWINRVAPASFTCYLIHEYALSFLNYEQIGALAFPLLLGVAIAVIVAVYALSVCVQFVWDAVIARVFPANGGKRIITAD